MRHVRIAFERHHEAAADVREARLLALARRCQALRVERGDFRQPVVAEPRQRSRQLERKPLAEADEVIAGNGSGHAVGQRFVPESSYHLSLIHI